MRQWIKVKSRKGWCSDPNLSTKVPFVRFYPNVWSSISFQARLNSSPFEFSLPKAEFKSLHYNSVCHKLDSLVQAFFWHFYGSGCSWSLPVRWVLKLKSLSFFSKSLSFLTRALEFIQKPWSFEDLELFFEKMTGFGGKLGKNAQNVTFVGELCANRSTFCSFTAKVLKIKWV